MREQWQAVVAFFYPGGALTPRARVAAVGAVILLAALALLLAAQLARTGGEARELALRTAAFERRAAAAESELAALRRRQSDGFRVVIDTGAFTVTLLRGGLPVRRMPCALGRGDRIYRDRKFDFTTPVGVHRILYKEEDPVWYRPDWAWLERGETVPVGITRAERGVEGILGKYRLELGDGIAIHGSAGRITPGPYTHGCIRLNPEDLEMVYRLVEVGTPVEIR